MERERGTHFAPESERIQYKSLAVSEQEAKQIITGAVAFAECIKIHTHTQTTKRCPQVMTGMGARFG